MIALLLVHSCGREGDLNPTVPCEDNGFRDLEETKNEEDENPNKF